MWMLTTDLNEFRPSLAAILCGGGGPGKRSRLCEVAGSKPRRAVISLLVHLFLSLGGRLSVQSCGRDEKPRSRLLRFCAR